MESVRFQVDPSSGAQDRVMEEHYRRLHYEAAQPQYWTQPPHKAVALTRLKRHLPAIPKKKGKESSKKGEHFDVPAHAKHYKDKYGSVSAHSTSAIYGALRAPHYHAIYGPSNMWYASVRSLNRGCPRDVIYPVEAYDWRDTVYEDVAKEVFTTPPVGTHPAGGCVCVVRRRPPQDGPPLKPRQLPRCKYCANGYAVNGSSNNVPASSKRLPPNSEKTKTSSVTEESIENKPEPSSRMSGYKKCISGHSKYGKSSLFNKGATKESILTRKSILECDVTAYDLIKKVAKTPSVSEIDDSDIDDNLSDNAVAKMNKAIQLHSKSPLAMSGTARQLANKKQAASFKKSQSENCIYNETGSVLVGGQRIFTDRHRSKSPDIDIICDTSNNSNEIENHFTRWRSASDESICIPDPDYDYSDDSDEETVIGLKYRNPKFTYSPPPIRKSSESAHNGLDYSSRELSKSMSSLLSDDTYVPSINVNYSNHSTRRSDSVSSLQDCDNYHLDENESEYVERSDTDDTRVADPIPSTSNLDPPENENLKRELKYESSSDCSSSGGTLSSEYPTWTSSSSNELKSILKKKRRRDNAIQEQEDANRVFHNSEEAKENQKKKQVQFLAGEQTKFFDSISVQDGDSRSETGDPEDSSPGSNGEHSSDEDIPSVINCDTYETLSEALSDKSWMESENNPRTEKYCQNEKYAEKEQALIDGEQSVQHTNGEQRNYHKSKTFKKFSNEVDLNDLHTLPKFKDHDIPPALPSSLPPKRPPGLSSSLDDVSGRTVEKSNLTNGKEKSYRRRWRTTLPKCRFSDLHILLCPSKSFCVDGSSSDDVPLTASPRKPQSRSLPDSPTELDEVPSFSFDFRDRNTKEKILAASRSVFYVPVDGQTKVPESNQNNTPVSDVLKNEKFSSQVSPSIEENHNNPSTGLRRKDTSDVEDVISADHYDTDEDILENDYENLDPIYEELHDVSNSSKRLTSLESNQKSFFEGASKIDILSYLEDAKERGISEGLSEDEKVIIEEEEDEDEKVLSGEEEDTGEKQRVIAKNDLNHKEVLLTIEKEVKIESVKIDETVEDDSKTRISEVERNDSGVGTETSKPCRLKQLPSDWEEQLCADCDHQVEPIEDENSGLLFSPLVCRKCEFRRCERKEIIIEFVDTELKYGRDLKIIKDEFYRPMEIAGLLAKDQLFSIFLNLEELINANSKFSEKLQDALDIAMEHGDEDYTTVNLGKIFLESSSMLHAFETYCVKQAPASVLLSSLEKEKELLRIFLRVSQMENTLLRRMNLPAFLMVPVQRVTRYPLLLSRLHKVTPIHHKDRGALKEAQQKVELHLEHINQQTKGVGGTKIWRRISNISASHRRLGKDIGSIKLRKMALEVLNWKQDETRFVMAGKLLFTQITDYPWNKKGKTIKFTCVHALLIALGKPNSNYRPDSSQLDNSVLFPRNTGIRDASLVLMKEKNGRFVVVRDPLYLGNCVISCESDTDDVFEIQEYTTKDAYLMKGETKKETKEWLRMLRYHAKDLGPWRKRRNALANIMINGMIRQ